MRDRKPPATDPELSTRDVEVLQAIIQDYIVSAGPVGSRSLTRQHGLEVSAATVRNVMADLEDLGYLAKPHTSAGRIPTPKAFRFYVDTLLRVRPLPSRIRARVDEGYQPPPESVDALIQHTGRVLSRLTQHAAVVAAPRLSQSVYRRINFIRLREGRVLAVLVTSSGLVQNRALTVDTPVTQDELDRVSAYLDELLDGEATTEEIQRRIARELADERARYDELMRRALELGQRAVAEAPGEAAPEVVVEGQSTFIEAPEFADPSKMRALLEALEEKQRLLGILEQAEHATGIQFFIGVESDLASDDVSMVLASYRRGEVVLGAMGVIGPTRMDYSRVVPFVEYTAAVLTRMFDGEFQ